MSKHGEIIRTIIVDDEKTARRGLRLLLDEVRDIEIVAECSNGREAVAAIAKYAPDLIFLDVQMPGLDGFDVLTRIDTASSPVVVFVTAYDSYALRAFEAHALDYLLKPFSNARFRETILRVKEHVKERELAAIGDRLTRFLAEHGSKCRSSTDANGGGCLERVPVKSGDRIFLLEASAIEWIEANDDSLLVHAGRQRYRLNMRMKDLEPKLDPRVFSRIHRSAIVNVRCVKELEPYFHGDYVVVMRDGTKLRLSRRRRHQFERLLGMPL